MKFPSQKIKFLIFGILILVFLNLFQREVKNFFYLISQSFEKILFKGGKGISDFFEIFLKAKDLKKENRALFLENQALKSQIASLKELERENEFLRKALNLGLQEDFQLLLTHFVSKDPLSDFILIDKGSKDGISTGKIVITEERFLLGKVTDVFDNFSKVMLITNKENKFAAKIQESNLNVIAEGKGNFQLFLDLIPQKAEIKKGNLVVSLNGNFPKGLLVGEIEEIQKSDVLPFQKAKIKPSFDLKNLENLFVIMDY